MPGPTPSVVEAIAADRLDEPVMDEALETIEGMAKRW